MKKFKKYAPKVLSAVLGMTIICGSIGTAAYSAGAKSVDAENTNTRTSASAEKASESPTSDSKDLSKEETVYVLADTQGKAKKVIVSDWIKNSAKENQIKDITNLSDIKNLKGDETYRINKDNMCVWDANGNDIYYQGTTSQALPVELTLSYTLDGKKISADELAGKSGKVTMRFDYNNTQYEKVKIDGKEEKIYVPFVMLTGMILDNNNFKNVEISNGKIINDGDRTYAAGFAFPGMQSNLNIDKDKLEVPDYVEITADVTDFQLATTLTLATNEVFSNMDFSKVDDKISDLSDSLKDLTDATDKLIDGSSQLYSGLNTLLDKSGELIEGVNKLSAGANQLKDGAKSLDSGVLQLSNGANTLDSGAASLNEGADSVDKGVAELQGYIAQLTGGLNTISENSGTLNAGAKQVFETLLATADAQLAAAGVTADKLTIENYDKVLDGVLSSLDKDSVKKLAYDTALKTVTATVKSHESYIRDAVESSVRKQITESVLAAAGYSMTADEYDSAVAAGAIPQEVQSQISSAVSSQMSSGDIQALIESKTAEQIQSLITENMSSDEVQSQINAAVEKAEAGAKSISSLKLQLDSFNQFYQGIHTYTAGVDTANEGAKKILSGSYALKDGTSALKNGTGDLKKGTGDLLSGTGSLKDGTSSLLNGSGILAEGINSLSGGSTELVDGVKQLKEGSMSLNDGLKQYKKEGIQVLVDAVDGDVKGLINRLKEISKVSSNYKSYSGIAEDMNGKVNFIYKTDAIENK